MPQGYAPAVFVSSTCYDLSKIRSNIKSFIETLGLEPVLSEFNTFPVNPDVNTVQNCLYSLDQKADVMVLLVGNRYGFQSNNGKSITNLEYLRAKAKGIPVYVFVHKSILSNLPVWEKNQMLISLTLLIARSSLNSSNLSEAQKIIGFSLLNLRRTLSILSDAN